MKIKDYKAMLGAVEQAIEICDESSDLMDQAHREICTELRTTQARLIRLIESAKREQV